MVIYLVIVLVIVMWKLFEFCDLDFEFYMYNKKT